MAGHVKKLKGLTNMLFMIFKTYYCTTSMGNGFLSLTFVSFTQDPKCYLIFQNATYCNYKSIASFDTHYNFLITTMSFVE